MSNEKPTETDATWVAEYEERVTRPACVCGHTAFEHADAKGECVHVETDGYARWPGDCTCRSYTATDSSECCVSGVCDDHNARNIARADRPQHARMVAAYRWLRANGFNANLDNREKRIGISIGNLYEPGVYMDVKALTEYGNWAKDILSTRPTSVAQAIDFLVVAGILPAEMASWAPQRETCSVCSAIAYWTRGDMSLCSHHLDEHVHGVLAGAR